MMIYCFMIMTFIIFLLFFGLWLLLIAPWSLNPRLIPKIQIFFLSFIFEIYWYSRLIIGKIFSQWKINDYGPRGCHKMTCPISKSSDKVIEDFDMDIIAKYISLPDRPNRAFYFLSSFVYPLLPLDLIGNKSDSWNRIYSCFNHILNSKQIVYRSEEITIKYSLQLAKKLKLDLTEEYIVSDKLIRYLICSIMWELIFDCEPNESDLKIIVELTESISSSFTYNIDPNWSKRIHLCSLFMKQIQSNKELLLLQNNFNLTSQEMCTVIAMEFFVTPALEIGETMTNLITELKSNNNNNNELIEKISSDQKIMRYAIIEVAHRYPVLQGIFREIPDKENDKNLTQCSNYFHDPHTVEIQTSDIANSLKNESIIDNINSYILNRNNIQFKISEIKTCMAFGKGQRICKGKELAIKIITSFLTNIYDELNQWPTMQLSAGRKYIAFYSKHHQLYYWHRRCWISDIQYYFDKKYSMFNLERFHCSL